MDDENGMKTLLDLDTFTEVDDLGRPINLLAHEPSGGYLLVGADVLLSQANSPSPFPQAIETRSTKEKDDIANLLKEWDLDQLTDTFVKQEIDLEVLKLMPSQFAEKIIADFTYGVQIRFLAKLAQWQRENSPLDEVEEISSERKSEASRKRAFEEMPCSISLEDIMNYSPEGRNLKTFYDANKKFSDTQREIMVDKIVHYFIEKDMSLTVATTEKISAEICKKFPTEQQEYYYIGRSGKAPKGKIYNKYQNDSRKLRLAGLKEPRRSRSTSKENKRVFEPETDAEDHIQWIQYENSSWAELESRWNKCSLHRLNEIQKSECTAQILSKWSSYKKPLGYKLIDIDYNILHPGSKSIFNKWELFMEKIVPILLRKLNTFPERGELEKFSELSKEGGAAVVIWCLSYLLTPTTRKVTKNSETGKKNVKKFTIKDSQNSIILFGTTTNDVSEQIDNKKKLGRPIQPFIVLIGPKLSEPSEILVYFDGIKYKLFTVVKAIDVCFKTMHTFNLEYPLESLAIWSFLQSYFYEISTSFDQVFTCAKLLEKELVG